MSIDRHLMTVLTRLIVFLVVAGGVAAAGLLLTYEVFGVEWISTMEIQPSYRPMEDPQPVPAGSVPIQGAAYVPGDGAPRNPVPADETSLARGQALYDVNCAVCHGPVGKGDGPMAEKFRRQPTDLTSANVTRLSDGDIFIVITHGAAAMPPLSENLSVGERWDVVNYVKKMGGE
ncbi:MAG: c-type cytochrome [Chloroflexota bacterium]